MHGQEQVKHRRGRTVAVVVLAAILGAGAGSVITAFLAYDHPEVAPAPSYSSQAPSPSPSAPSRNVAVQACAASARELRRFLDRTVAAYQPANELGDSVADRELIDTCRAIAADLFTIEVQLRAVVVPSGLSDSYALLVEFVGATLDTYEEAVLVISAEAPTDERIERLLTLIAEGDRAKDVVDRQLERFKPSTCSS